MSKKQFRSMGFIALLCVTASVSNADLIAYWPLDEGEGTVAEDIVGGFDGQITGGTWYTPGQAGDAAYEGSGGNEINCGAGPSPTTEDLTLAWWMIDNHVSYGTIMDKSVAGSGLGYNVLVRPSNEDSPLRFRIGGWQTTYGGWGAECRLPLGAYNEGEWVHIVCTYESATDTASIYVNGELPLNGNFNPKTGIAGPGGYCQGVNHLEAPLSIRGGQEGFNGVLDEVAIWDQALTADEVMTVFRLGPTALDSDQSIPLEIESSGSDLNLGWESKAGMFYNLQTSTDLAADPSTWDSVNVPGSVDNGGVFEIATNPPLNTHSIPRPGDPLRFYRVQEFALPPPPPLFEENFDGVVGPGLPDGWSTAAGTTAWEVGNPTGGAFSGPPVAKSGLSCAGTGIGADYLPSTSYSLISPAIAVPAGGATLRYEQFIDTDEQGDVGTIRILDVDNADALIEVLNPPGDIEGISAGWTAESIPLPAAANGANIKIEFRLVSNDNTFEFAGFYVDDVRVEVN